MQPLDYLHTQMRLEEIGFDAEGHLIPLQGGTDEFPSFVLAQLADGKTIQYFPAALAPKIQAEIQKLSTTLVFPDVQPIKELLKRWQIETNVGHFKTHRFPEAFQTFQKNRAAVFSKTDPRIMAFGFGGIADPVYAVEQAGTILSACVSIRQDDFCAECWVATTPDQRGKGLGAAVVALWAKEILSAGKIPFYSHAVTNLPSARLANKLELIPIYEEVVLEKAESGK